ncbi:MAG: hypothetical protein NTY77_02415 [Elusimicrobia bacterium]|nr:hypothetical protein [Elusimicrobiota bacterium]
MRRSENNRHPLFENVVFGLALLLVAILVFYAARGLLARRFQVPPHALSGYTPEARPAQTSEAGSATETAVSSIPPIKLSHTGSPRAWRVEVPSPTGKKPKK